MEGFFYTGKQIEVIKGQKKHGVVTIEINAASDCHFCNRSSFVGTKVAVSQY